MSLLPEDVKLLDNIRNQYLERETKGLAVDCKKLEEQLNCLESGILIIRAYLAMDLKKQTEALQEELQHLSLDDMKKAERHLSSQIEIPIKKDEDELLPWLALAEEAIQHSEDSSIQRGMGQELFLDLALLTYNIMQQNNLKLMKMLEEKIKEKQHQSFNQEKTDISSKTSRNKP